MGFITERQKIIRALIATGISEGNIILKRHIPPTELPAAFVYLAGKQGRLRSRHIFNGFDLDFKVFLIVGVNEADDPDAVILAFEELFRDKFRNEEGDDFATVKYSQSAMSNGKKVMMAELSTLGGLE